MKIKLSIFIWLCVTLSCHGSLEKLLDSLNVGGDILKGISHTNNYDSVQRYPNNGQYSNVYGGSSSASYNYGGSIGDAIKGFGVSPQTNNHRGLMELIIKKYQLNNKGELVPDSGFSGTSYGNGFGGQLQETILENYQQNNGFTEGGGYHSKVPQTGNLGLSFNINLGSLFGQGHSTNYHSHHHGHKQEHGQGDFNSDFFHGITPNNNVNGHWQIYNQNGGFDRPEHTGYQNYDSQNPNHNVGNNKLEHIGHQNEPNNHEATYATLQPDVSIYNPNKNSNPSGLYNDNLTQNPIYNDGNETPSGKDEENRNKNVPVEQSVPTSTEIVHVSTTEFTKMPYENEKNSKVTSSNRKTTIRPESDQPLLVPLNSNEYTYEGDKIQISSPKRNANDNNKKQEINEKEEDFDIDVRFNDDE